VIPAGTERWARLDGDDDEYMSIEIANESGMAVDEPSIVAAARFALDRLGVSKLAELSVLLVELEVMADLHERWMELPGPTDVMAFPMDELDSARRPDAAEAGPTLLGDIVLCPAFARDQARQAGHSLIDELHLLTVHGVLHLLGYDHAEPAEEREMFTLQKRILADFRSARSDARRRAAQRREDDKLLGAVGLGDSRPPDPDGATG
jgi:probable rRNA maturation factor